MGGVDSAVQCHGGVLAGGDPAAGRIEWTCRSIILDDGPRTIYLQMAPCLNADPVSSVSLDSWLSPPQNYGAQVAYLNSQACIVLNEIRRASEDDDRVARDKDPKSATRRQTAVVLDLGWSHVNRRSS